MPSQRARPRAGACDRALRRQSESRGPLCAGRSVVRQACRTVIRGRGILIATAIKISVTTNSYREEYLITNSSGRTSLLCYDGPMSIEKRVAVRARRGEIKNAILQVAALAGLLSIAFVAPNVPKVIPRSLLNKVFGRSRSARDVTVSRLLKDGLLAVEMRDGTRMLRITEKGKRYLAKTKLRAANVPRRWDRRWRVVIFDIKEHRRHVRRNLRSELQAYGFYRLQDRVWVFPYACEDFIALLKADLHVGKDILYLVAEEVENERHLRDYFGIGTGGRSA